MKREILSYTKKNKRIVKGWLQRTDAEIMARILQFQSEKGIRGACLEIGVHHGKSFIPLCMSLHGDEMAMCIDLFDDQDKNLDASGKGDLEKFNSNLDYFKIDKSKVFIHKGSSEEVTSDYILKTVGKVRFFSIDGGHWSTIVQNDLRLAEATLCEDGVISLDDYCRAEWPDVTYGYALWQNQTQSDIVPFAAGSNKLFLCRRDHAAAYRRAVQSPFLLAHLSKTYKSNLSEVDCYRTELIEQDETGLKNSLKLALKIFRPDIFHVLKKF